MGNPNDSRIVLLPQGPVQSEDNEIFTQLLFRLGADIDRFWTLPGTDPKKSEVQRYIQYLQRSRLGNCPEMSKAIVALTRTNPPPITMIPLRRQLETAFPALRSALWVAWVDMQENPFIFGDLRKLGTVMDEAGEAPIWIEDGKRAYLILVPDCQNINKLREQAVEVARINIQYDSSEAITSKRKALQQTDTPRPSSPASFSRPLSWTERGNKPPRHSQRVTKPPESPEPTGRLVRTPIKPRSATDDTSYRFASEYPTGSGTKRRKG